jgi:hypothetical protein
VLHAAKKSRPPREGAQMEQDWTAQEARPVITVAGHRRTAPAMNPLAQSIGSQRKKIASIAGCGVTALLRNHSVSNYNSFDFFIHSSYSKKIM